MKCPINSEHGHGWCIHKTLMLVMMMVVIGGIVWAVAK